MGVTKYKRKMSDEDIVKIFAEALNKEIPIQFELPKDVSLFARVAVSGGAFDSGEAKHLFEKGQILTLKYMEWHEHVEENAPTEVTTITGANLVLCYEPNPNVQFEIEIGLNSLIKIFGELYIEMIAEKIDRVGKRLRSGNESLLDSEYENAGAWS